jgi:nitroreductase
MSNQFQLKAFSIGLLWALSNASLIGLPKKQHKRTVQNGVSELFVHRWSPRAMSGESVTDQELYTLFEAARWAPSSYNSQPWRFIYAKRNTPAWNVMFDLLVDFNKQWAQNAGALVLIVSKDTFDHNGEPSRTHSFDTGAAWQNFALQGSINGLVVHGMGGFDYERAKSVLRIPSGYTIQAMAAIGKPGSLNALPSSLRDMEKPSDRNELVSFVFEGAFKS